MVVALFALATAMVACSGGSSTPAATATAAAKATTAATAAPTFAAGSTMAALKTKGKIVIGVKYDVPLFGQLDPTTKKVDGFDVAIGKEIAKELGLTEDKI